VRAVAVVPGEQQARLVVAPDAPQARVVVASGEQPVMSDGPAALLDD